MKKKVVILTRFSVIGSSWKLARQEKGEYIKALFDGARLRQRLDLFSSITIPSLLALRDREEFDLEWLVFTSDILPGAYLRELHELVAQVPRSKVVPVEEGADLRERISRGVSEAVTENCIFATVRLDDDDGLSSEYLALLTPYLQDHFAGYCVSFPRGCAGLYSAEKGVTEVRENYTPLIALGLALINKRTPEGLAYERPHIQAMGNHRAIDRKAPVIMDARANAYFWTVHAHSDRRFDTLRSRILKARKVTGEELRAEFAWAPSLNS